VWRLLRKLLNWIIGMLAPRRWDPDPPLWSPPMALKLYAKLDGTLANEQDGTQTGAFEGANADPSYVAGRLGQALSFSGVEGDKIVVFEEKAATKIAGEITISVWWKTNETFPGAPAADPQKEMITRGGGNLSFGWEEDNVENFVWLRCYLRDSNDTAIETEYRDDSPQPGYRDNAWHHYLVRFKPSTGPSQNDGLLNLWVDGVEVDNEDGHDLQDLKVSGVSDHWCIGGRKSSTPTYTRNLVGLGDEVQIYDEYVDNAKIAELAFPPASADPVAPMAAHYYHYSNAVAPQCCAANNGR